MLLFRLLAPSGEKGMWLRNLARIEKVYKRGYRLVTGSVVASLVRIGGDRSMQRELSSLRSFIRFDQTWA